MKSDRFGLRYFKYETHTNSQNVEVSAPVVSESVYCVKPHIWYYFIIRGMRSKDLAEVLLFYWVLEVGAGWIIAYNNSVQYKYGDMSMTTKCTKLHSINYIPLKLSILRTFII